MYKSLFNLSSIHPKDSSSDTKNVKDNFDERKANFTDELFFYGGFLKVLFIILIKKYFYKESSFNNYNLKKK